MSKYALIAVGGKQYKVSVGETLEIQKLEGAAGSVVFDQVLMVVDGDQVEVGTPNISGMTVTATYIEDKKGEKIQVFKYKSKSKYRKMRGARQTLSYLKIDAIGAPEKKVSSGKAQIDSELAEGKKVAPAKESKTVAKKPAVKKSAAKKAPAAK